MSKYKMLAYALIALASLVALHQYINWGCWFEIEDIHHETFIASLIFGAVTLFIYFKWWRKNGWKEEA